MRKSDGPDGSQMEKMDIGMELIEKMEERLQNLEKAFMDLGMNTLMLAMETQAKMGALNDRIKALERSRE